MLALDRMGALSVGAPKVLATSATDAMGSQLGKGSSRMLPLMKPNHTTFGGGKPAGRALPKAPVPTGAVAQLAVLQRLTHEIQQLETSGRRAAAEVKTSSAGCVALDALLPAGGYEAGSVVEYLRTAPACGASTLAWGAAAAAMQATSGFLVVVDTQHNVFPPTLTSHGIDLGKVIFVRPQSQADALWAVDQALRTSAVAAVVAELERIDDRSARRLQLAAECGAGLALLLRSAAARKQPSWAEVQWLVRTVPTTRATGPLSHAPLSMNSRASNSQASNDRDRECHDSESRATLGASSNSARGRRWLVQLARVRGGRAGQSVCLEIDPLTGQLKLAAPLDSQHRNSHGDSAHHTPAPSKSAVHLAAQLAHAKTQPAAQQSAGQSTERRRAPSGGEPHHRQAAAG